MAWRGGFSWYFSCVSSFHSCGNLAFFFYRETQPSVISAVQQEEILTSRSRNQISAICLNATISFSVPTTKFLHLKTLCKLYSLRLSLSLLRACPLLFVCVKPATNLDSRLADPYPPPLLPSCRWVVANCSSLLLAGLAPQRPSPQKQSLGIL